MTAFSKSRASYFAISRFESYGDLINIISVFLAIIEFILFGFELALLLYFIMITLFVFITIMRFFIVLSSHENRWKNRLSISYNTTICSAFLIAIIWGGSCFFISTNTPYFLFIHALFLFLVAFVFSIFFSSLPVLSPLITTCILAPISIQLFTAPPPGMQSLSIAAILVSIALMIFSFFHGREVLTAYKQTARARKNQLRLHACNKRIKSLEQFIPRPNRTLLGDEIDQSKQMWDIFLTLTAGPESEKPWQACFSLVFPAIINTLKADGVFIARENGEQVDSFGKTSINQKNHFSWIFSISPLQSTLLDGQAIHRIDSDFPDNQRNILTRERIKTVLLVPIFVGDQFWGVFGLTKRRSSSYFSQLHVNFFYFLANILSLNIRSEKNRTETKRLTTVVEQSDDCIIITDPAGEILYTNKACEQVTGYTPDELTGKDVKKLNRSENRRKIWEEIDNALLKKEKWHGQFINKRNDDTLYEEEMIISPVHDIDGKQTNLVIIKRNITEAKRLESIAEAANLMDNIGYIFSSLRHELGNPINSLKVSLSILESNLDSYDANDIKRFLRRNLSDIKRVEYLLTTLRNFSVFEKPQIKPVNMVDILSQFTTLIKQDIQEKNIKLILNIPRKKIIGLIDPRAFQQVLLNLTTNAIDSLEDTTNKRIAITLYQEEKNQIKLTIGDNGCGIDREEQANLFRPFFTTKPQGTGLGLVIVKKMLSKMHCSIDIHSKKSIGTQIFIIVPSAGIKDAPKTQRTSATS